MPDLVPDEVLRACVAGDFHKIPFRGPMPNVNPVEAVQPRTAALMKDFARELLAAREAIRGLVDISRAEKVEEWGSSTYEFYRDRDHWGEPAGKYCLVCHEKSSWNTVAKPAANHAPDCPVRVARACLPEHQGGIDEQPDS